MSEMLDSMSTVGVDWDTGASPPIPNGILPCSDSLWAFPEHIINVWSFGQFRYSSAFSLCIIFSTNELWGILRFLQKTWDLSNTHDRIQWQTEAQKIDERLTAWREEFVAAVYRLINAEYAEEERAEMDPNIVLTNCVLDVYVRHPLFKIANLANLFQVRSFFYFSECLRYPEKLTHLQNR